MNNFASFQSLPVSIEVDQLVSARYPDGKRPPSWDNRKQGLDVVKTVDGQLVQLLSNGGQTPPQKNWKLVLTGGDVSNGYTWTLYGIQKAA